MKFYKTHIIYFVLTVLLYVMVSDITISRGGYRISKVQAKEVTIKTEK